MNKPLFFSWVRRQPRRIIQSKPVAYIIGELPPYDANSLFCSFSEYPLVTDWRYNVHMTAKNALIGKTHFRQLQDFIRLCLR